MKLDIQLNRLYYFSRVNNAPIKRGNKNIVVPSEHNPIRYTGLYGSARSWLVSRLIQEHRHLCVICKNRKSAEELVSDLSFFERKKPIFLFTGWETIPFESVSPQIDVSATRLAIQRELQKGQPSIIVFPIDAIIQRVMPKEFLAALCRQVRVGDSAIKEELAELLKISGYQPVSLCEEIGDTTIHGSVIDVFIALNKKPVRLFFEGERITSIKSFDPNTQRTLEDLEEIEIIPAKEITPYKTHPNFQNLLSSAIDRIHTRGQMLDTPTRELNEAILAVSEGVSYPGIELLEAIAQDTRISIFDYLPADSTIVMDEELAISQALDSIYDNIAERHDRLVQEHYLIPKVNQQYLSPEEYALCLGKYEIHSAGYLDILSSEDLSENPPKIIRSKANTELSTRLKTGVGTGHAMKPLADFIRKVRRRDWQVCFSVGSKARAEKLYQTLLSINIEARIPDISASEWLNSPRRYPVVILQGNLTDGFQLDDEKLVFISENEVFAEKSFRKTSHTKLSLKRLMGSLAQLSEGDCVVHVDYGIGLYHGLKHLDIEGEESDFLHIEYADSVLYLPVQNIGKVQKFVAQEGQKPTLDKLGSTRWIKTKQKVKESVASLAGDLIKLYATRSVARGWRFEPYGAEDERFAEDFPYDETPDQDAAIKETLRDMSTEKPMDRLVCGDVGFGKTEVALRAAFKCLQHTRQVAVLVPTTILAEQHYNTFKKRFADYPAKVAVISRFQSPADNKKTLSDLANGELDLIVGTHRLLSKDVVFKDLGLVIIDEEHRFGVKQKEKLKALKKQVDVLTLTATPIPRTLHMSLLGIRDISVISTPPTDRRLIRTYLATWDETLVRDAIIRELQRGGQCFFLHNRVQSIDLVCSQLSQLVPEARFAFAHGQMSEKQLEPIMERFLKQEIDVLVSTTIIESGIDIPNANTIIIDRADACGLAQLYQLRGRVGRSNKQAYCYFLVPKARKLGVEAQKRLKALQSLDDLGLGFNLALRDMEIRGVGNLLGREQSGNVIAVGYELYSKILKEAVLNLKGEEIELKETIDPEIKLGINAYIPQDYIPDISERLVLYQRFSAIDHSREADNLLEEVEDRYGTVNQEARNLIELMRLRSLLRRNGVVKAEAKNERLILSFSPAAPVDLNKLMELTKKQPDKYRFGKNLTLSVAIEEGAGLHDPVQVYVMCDSLFPRVIRET